MILKQIIQGGVIAWTNSKKNSYLFATGSVNLNNLDIQLSSTQQQNNEESRDYYLQIFTLDVQDGNMIPQCIGKTRVEFGFRSIAWGNFGEEDQYPLGIIIGGMDDGSVLIFDPNDIVNYYKKFKQQVIQNSKEQNIQEISEIQAIIDREIESNIGCLCYEQNLFETPVYSIEFNPFKSNLIAIGGGEEVFIMNIDQNISQPQIFQPGTTNLHKEQIVTSVSWNKKVQHILASASSNGFTVVWDLKTNKSIFNFQNNQLPYFRNIQLSWNPIIPTQIAVSNGDTKNPELSIWDLRNPQGPIMLFSQGHNKEITSLDWCVNDPQLILTGGKDNKIVCWNIQTGEMDSEVQLEEEALNLKWSPKIPSSFGVSSQPSGNITIYTLNSSELTDYAPKWYLPPVGARFSVNGRLVMFKEKNQGQVKQFKVSAKHDSVSQALDELFEIFKDESSFEGYCNRKLSQLKLKFDNKAEQEQNIWEFIQGISLGQEELQQKLGFNKNDIIKLAEQYTGKVHSNKQQSDSNQKRDSKSNNKVLKQAGFEIASMSEQDAENFFDQLSVVSQQKQMMNNTTDNLKGEQKQQKLNKEEQEVYTMESISKNTNWNTGIEKIIKQNLLIGNFEGAVDCLFKCGRIAEALLLAQSQGPKFFEQTAQSFFIQNTDPFIRNVFKNIIEKNNVDLANKYDLTAWKEVAALTLSNGNTQDFTKNLNILGQRFQTETKDDDSALLCYILSQNLDGIIEIFFKKLKSSNNKSIEKNLLIIGLTEKLVTIKTGLNQQFKNETQYNQLFQEFSQLCLRYQKPILAFKILTLANYKNNQDFNFILDLIYQSNLNELTQINLVAPINPYKVQNVVQVNQGGVKHLVQQEERNQKLDKNMRPQQKFPLNNNIIQNSNNIESNSNIQHQPIIQQKQPLPVNKFVPNMPKQPIIQNKLPINLKEQSLQNDLVDRPPLNHSLTEKKQTQTQLSGNTINNVSSSQKELTNPNDGQQVNQSNLSQNKQINQPFQQNQSLTSNQSSLPQQPFKNNPFGQVSQINNSIPPPNKQQLQQNRYVSNFVDQTQQKNQENVTQQKKNINLPPPPIVKNLQQTEDKPQNLSPKESVSQLRQDNSVISSSIQQKNSLSSQYNLLNQSSSKSLQNTPVIQQQQPKEVDLNSLSPQLKSLISTLRQSSKIIEIIEHNPKKRQDLENNMQHLYQLIAQDKIKSQTLENIKNICIEINNDNMQAALAIIQIIAKQDWEHNKEWIVTLKRILLKK